MSPFHRSGRAESSAEGSTTGLPSAGLQTRPEQSRCSLPLQGPRRFRCAAGSARTGGTRVRQHTGDTRGTAACRRCLRAAIVGSSCPARVWRPAAVSSVAEPNAAARNTKSCRELGQGEAL